MVDSMRHILNLEEPAEALSANNDYSMVMVAGRQIMKVFEIIDGGFKERYNLRQTSKNKQLHLNYSACHVAWSPVQHNLIATTSTNGSVVIWNLERSSNYKMEIVYTSHTRAATKVCFHTTDANMLISGSKDARINLYDLRLTSSPVRSYTVGGSDSVRDMQFGLHANQQDTFVVGDDSGHVRFWDLRRADRPYKQFPAHQGHVASIDLHPNPHDKNLVATGGRDKFIRVWDWSKSSPEKPIYVVETASSIARVYWRPQQSWHIASSSVINDFAINVWDIRRPFLPCASFEEHRDVATDMAWSSDKPDAFISTGRDGLLIWHTFDRAQRPLDYANEVAVDISPGGDVAIAVSCQLRSKAVQKALDHKQPPVSTTLQTRTDQFGGPVTSDLHSCHFPHEETLSMDWFIQSARRYKLNGASFGSLCDHNAQIAEDLRRFQELCSHSADLKCTGNQSIQCPNVPCTWSSSSSIGRSLGDVLEIEEENQLAISDSDRSVRHAVEILANTADFFFGADELNTSGLVIGSWSNFYAAHQITEWGRVRMSEEWQGDLLIKPEAFVPRSRDLTGRSSPSPTENRHLSPNSLKSPEVLVKRPKLLRICSESLDCLPQIVWNPSSLVVDLLVWYAEKGDIQMTVSVLLVLGEKAKCLVDETLCEFWFMEYLDLLDRFQLWSTSATVIKQCFLPSVNCLSQDGTCQVLCCGICSTPTGRNGWNCPKCRKSTACCAVCQLPVRGLYACCQSCGHGGHLEHIMEWFDKYLFCPIGCGHKCQIRM